jgi:hypothetical protein
MRALIVEEDESYRPVLQRWLGLSPNEIHFCAVNELVSTLLKFDSGAVTFPDHVVIDLDHMSMREWELCVLIDRVPMEMRASVLLLSTDPEICQRAASIFPEPVTSQLTFDVLKLQKNRQSN